MACLQDEMAKAAITAALSAASMGQAVTDAKIAADSVKEQHETALKTRANDRATVTPALKSQERPGGKKNLSKANSSQDILEQKRRAQEILRKQRAQEAAAQVQDSDKKATGQRDVPVKRGGLFHALEKEQTGTTANPQSRGTQQVNPQPGRDSPVKVQNGGSSDGQANANTNKSSTGGEEGNQSPQTQTKARNSSIFKKLYIDSDYQAQLNAQGKGGSQNAPQTKPSTDGAPANHNLIVSAEIMNVDDSAQSTVNGKAERFVNYCIKVSHQNGANRLIWHRYTAFRNLHRQMISKFGKDDLPSMTGKKINRFSPAIIHHRVMRLNELLYHICSQQKLRDSEIFHRFLSVDNNVRLAFNTGDFTDEDGDRTSS